MKADIGDAPRLVADEGLPGDVYAIGGGNEVRNVDVVRMVIRGLHFQTPPFPQDKLVRAVLDVAVDLRRTSPTFGRVVSEELSADNWLQLFVPKGFAHGFCTLTPNVEVFYKVTEHYAPDHDAGVAWDDPDLAVAWPVAAEQALLSEKDRRLPRLADLAAVFE